MTPVLRSATPAQPPTSETDQTASRAGEGGLDHGQTRENPRDGERETADDGGEEERSRDNGLGEGVGVEENDGKEKRSGDGGPGEGDGTEGTEHDNKPCFGRDDCEYAKRVKMLKDYEPLRAKIHWCKHYIAVLAGTPLEKTDYRIPPSGNKKLVWLKEHSDWIERFCAHYAWYGLSGGYEGLTRPEMAKKLLEEVGGCTQKYEFCNEMKMRVAKKLENICSKTKPPKKAGSVLGPVKFPGAPLGGVDNGRGRKLSAQGLRDKRLRDVLREYKDLHEIRTALVLIVGKFTEMRPELREEIPGLSLESLGIPPDHPTYNDLCFNEFYPTKENIPIPIENKSSVASDTEDDHFWRIRNELESNVVKRSGSEDASDRVKKRSRREKESQ